MPVNRPRSRQEGYITIVKEYRDPGDELNKRHVLLRMGDELFWRKYDWGQFANGSNLIQADVVWRDIFVSGIDWGRDPVSVEYRPNGSTSERNDNTGIKPTISFKSALISRELWKVNKFRVKYRILLEYKDGPTLQPYESLQFKGVSVKSYKAGGSDLVEQDIGFHVEELPDE